MNNLRDLREESSIAVVSSMSSIYDSSNTEALVDHTLQKAVSAKERRSTKK
jgi:hypothetical protein